MLVALRGGVGGVFLHVAGDVVDVFEEEGQEADVVLLGERGVHGVEFFDVVGAVAGGEGDAGEDDFGTAGLELREHAGEVGLGLVDGQAAEAVVAAELDDDDFGMAGEDEVDAVEAVLGGVAADAGVDDVVVEALGVEEALEFVGVGLAEVGAEAGGERVAETDDEVLRGVLRGWRGALRGGLGGRLGRWREGGGGGFGAGVSGLAATEGKAGGERGQSHKSNNG